MKKQNYCLILLCSFLLGSCASYRVVKVKPKRGGVVALKPGFEGVDAARLKAEGEMNRVCPNGYEIVEEGEVVVGSRTSTKTRASKKNQTVLSGSNADTESKNVTEWRMTYKCKRR